MVMKKLLKKFVDILRVNTVVKMFRFDDCTKKILQLELTIEHQQQQMDDLRKIILELSNQINSLQLEIKHLSETKYGKGL
jgi:cell division protein FtsL